MFRHILLLFAIIASVASAFPGPAMTPAASGIADRRNSEPHTQVPPLAYAAIAHRLQQQRKAILSTIRQLRQDLLRHAISDDEAAYPGRKSYGSQLTKFPSWSRNRGRQHDASNGGVVDDSQAVLRVAKEEAQTMRLVKRRREKVEESYYRVTYADEDGEDDSNGEDPKPSKGKSRGKHKSKGKSPPPNDDPRQDEGYVGEISASRQGGGRSGHRETGSVGEDDGEETFGGKGPTASETRPDGGSRTKSKGESSADDGSVSSYDSHPKANTDGSEDRQRPYDPQTGDDSEANSAAPLGVQAVQADKHGSDSSGAALVDGAASTISSGRPEAIPGSSQSEVHSGSEDAGAVGDINAYALPLGSATSGAVPPTRTKSDGSPNLAGVVPVPTLTRSLPITTGVASNPQPTTLDSNLEYVNEAATPIHMPRHPIFWQECVALSRLYVEMAGPLWLYQQGWELAPAYYELYKDREARPGYWTKWPGGVNYYEGPEYPEGYEEREDGQPGAQKKRPKKEEGDGPVAGGSNPKFGGGLPLVKRAAVPLDNLAQRRLLEKRRSTAEGYGRQSNSSETDGEPSNDRNLTMPICCKWTGIGCSKDGDVVHLDLGGFGLAGNFSDAPFEFNRLLRMNLSDNAIIGHIPNEFEQLPYLQDIYLRNNLISGPVPDSMQKSGQGWGYSHVDISHNGLTGHASINMDVIRQLDVSHNQLNTIELQMQPSLRYILTRRVDLSYNYLSGNMPDLQEATEIVNFTAYMNNFTGPIFNISRLHRLENLDVRHNSLSGPFPFSILNSTTIQSFKIGFNKFTGPFPDVEAPPTLQNCTARPNTFDSYPAKSTNNRTLANVCGVYGNLRVPGILDPVLDDDVDAPPLNGTIVPVANNHTDTPPQGIAPVLPKLGANSFAALPSSSSSRIDIPSLLPPISCMLAILFVLAN